MQNTIGLDHMAACKALRPASTGNRTRRALDEMGRGSVNLDPIDLLEQVIDLSSDGPSTPPPSAH